MKAGDSIKAWIMASMEKLGIVDNMVMRWLASQAIRYYAFFFASNLTLAQSPVASEVALLLARDVEVDDLLAIGNNLWLVDLPEGPEISRALFAQK